MRQGWKDKKVREAAEAVQEAWLKEVEEEIAEVDIEPSPELEEKIQKMYYIYCLPNMRKYFQILISFSLD